MYSKRRIIGPAFGDYIGFEQHKRHHYDDQKGDARGYLPLFLLIIFFGILLFRLVHLQFFQGGYYRALSDTNRIRTTTIYAPRGIIFDRNGVPLVFNIPGFRTIVGGKTVLLSREEALKRIADGEKNISIDNLRQYPYKEMFAHVLGYIGQITQEELANEEFAKYNPGDLIGRTGIEGEYESLLKGINGKQLAEVNAAGKAVRTLGQTDPFPGKDIALTLDSKLQIAAYSALKNVEKGAIVVATPKGEVLAIVSKPSYDPNLFTLGKHYKPTSDSVYNDISQVLLDEINQPLLNRAIAGVYPPGSTFKLITAAAGIDLNLIDEKYTIEDTGVLTIGSFSFANWYFTQYGKTEGEVNVIDGIKRSNDIFFYKLAELIGVEKLTQKAISFGLGKPLGIDLEGEEGGVVPSDAWKRKVIGEQWYLGDTYHYGIGQGYLLTTPLQVNTWTQTIANGGALYKPYLLKSQKSKVKSQNLIREKAQELIRRGMIESCSSGGVAWPLFKLKVENGKLKIDGKNFLEPLEATSSAQFNQYREISIACKTGTAQHGGEKDLPHAWITLFAPAYDPQIVVTVLAESSGEGSNIAAPIAKKVLEEWFGRQ